MQGIRRDFLPEHLQKVAAAASIDGVVSVQAQQTVGETQWLLDLADNHSLIKGVVGWVELASPKVRPALERFAGNKKLKAVRHVVQAEPDDNFLLRDDFNRGVKMLEEFSLAYDILIFARHLPVAIQFVDRHPNQVFVLDHMAKPRIKGHEISPWRENIRKLARRPNVYCKISGLVTEADYQAWTKSELRLYFDVVLEAFGPERLMFGSDWPVCLVACDYAQWHQIVLDWVMELSAKEQSQILGGTAMDAYQL